MKLSYIYAKIIKKLRGKAVLDSKVHSESKIESGSVIVRSFIDKHSFCGYDCSIVDAEVGPFTSIGSRVTIGGATHPMHFVTMSPVFLSHKDSVRTKFARHKFMPIYITSIGADVWIGDGAYIKAGVSIGHGAVIGMGSIVTRDVPPYAVVAGNPARLIRKRFDDEICEALLASKWWCLSDENLLLIGHLINDPQKFVTELKKYK